ARRCLRHHRAAEVPYRAACNPGGSLRRQHAKEWKLAGPKGEQGLVFPGRDGGPKTMQHSGYWPAQRAAGVIDTKGRPKYPGLHALRHFFASWYINRRQDGGLELPSKVVQERLGHSTIVMTSDTYGHLFPRGDDAKELAAAEQGLLRPVGLETN